MLHCRARSLRIPRTPECCALPRWKKRLQRQMAWQPSYNLSEKQRLKKHTHSRERGILRNLVALMGNAFLYDWAWVFSYEEKRKQLNQFALGARSIVPILHVAWPAVWYLTRYSRKYIFITSSISSTIATSNYIILTVIINVCYSQTN